MINAKTTQNVVRHFCKTKLSLISSAITKRAGPVKQNPIALIIFWNPKKTSHVQNGQMKRVPQKRNAYKQMIAIQLNTHTLMKIMM